MSTWNYRILVHVYKEETYFMVHEVYYNKDGVPDRYSAKPVRAGGEDLEDIENNIKKFMEALKKPVLWLGDKFPDEYII